MVIPAQLYFIEGGTTDIAFISICHHKKEINSTEVKVKIGGACIAMLKIY
jgi:hypothetical protein